MKPRTMERSQSEIFRSRLTSIINLKHRLKIFADRIDWSFFEKEFDSYYTEGCGAPPKPIRLMVGLLMLQHTYKLSDEQVVDRWVENAYWQYFCGSDFLKWEAPINPSSLTRFRNRLGPEGAKKILQATIQEGLKQKAIEPKDLKKVVADTTVMEKNIAHPTDTALLNKARKNLVNLAKEHNIPLRQNYERVGPKKVLQASRYAHAKQFKRMHGCIRKLKTYLGRVVRDIERRLEKKKKLEKVFKSQLEIAVKLLEQTKKSKDKIYSIHEPDVYCISKGKVKKPYEFGSKVSIITTQEKGFVLNADALEKNQFDGHTLKKSLEEAENLSGQSIKRVLVDKGYKGHGVKDKKVYISGQKRGVTKYMKREMKKRSAIEAHISHMKNHGKLDRNYLKGIVGDKINAFLCAVGHNLRHLLANNNLIIAKIRQLFGCFSIFQRVAK